MDVHAARSCGGGQRDIQPLNSVQVIWRYFSRAVSSRESH